MKANFLSKTRLFNVVIFLLGTQFIFAGTTINGKISDAKNAPVEFANVIVTNSESNEFVKGDITNEKGHYQIDNLNTGEYLLTVSMVGFAKSEPIKISVLNTNNKTIEKNIVLKETIGQLNEVQVVAKKVFMEQTTDKTIINPEASITSASENVFEILKKLPGVSVDNNENISLKGKQGVNVMIDDKPTYLSNTELATMLRSMQGKNINKIEIIENPSARFDAEGNSGIINIKTKHNKAAGLNGSINGGIRQASKLGGNAGIDLNMNSGKLNLYGNYSFYAWNEWHALDANRRFTSSSLLGAKQTINTKTDYNGSSHNFKFGADYYLTNNQVISIMYRGNLGYNDNAEVGKTVFVDKNSVIDSSLQTISDRGHNWNNKTLNVNYKWDIDSLGQTFTVDADYAHFNFNSNSNQMSTNFDRNGIDTHRDIDLVSVQMGDIRIITAKADYVKPFGKVFNVETGIKASFVKTDNTASMVGYVAQDDQFIYDENIQAVYMNGQMNLKKTSVQLGLRLENTNLIGKSISTNTTNTDSYLKLFPSLFVQQSLNADNKINLRYSYRIGRPRYYALNPFIIMVDPYTYDQGNPLLKPQFTHSASLSHSFKGILNTSFGYNFTKDVFTQVLFQDDESKTVYQTQENLSNSIDWNLSENFQLEPFQWWHLSGTLTGMYKVVNANIGGKVQFENWNVQGNINNNFTLNKIIELELNGYYSSKQLNGNFILNPRYNVDFGIQCKLLDSKLILKAGVNDIFNSNQTNGYSKYNNVNLDFKNSNDSRQLNISVIYRFGKDDFKTRANRSTASSEEQNRSAK